MSELAIRIEGLRKRYGAGDAAVDALKGVDRVVNPGEELGLIGPSGSGKSTLLKCLGAVTEPTAGKMTLGGKTIFDDGWKIPNLSELRRDNIGFVFQAYNLIPVLSAYENIEFIMQLQGVPAENRRKKADAILEEVGLTGMGERRPAQMSGGQQQRIAVARAIVSRPSIVLADEPTANLDSHTSNELLDLMKQLNREHNTTFIIATHDQQVIDFTQRHIHMIDGKIDKDKKAL